MTAVSGLYYLYWKGALCFFVLGGFDISKAYTKGRCYYNKGYIYNTFITAVKRRLKTNGNIK